MAREILEGYRIIDMTMYQLGPVNTMMLATLGAEVIKIEAPTGEPGRWSFLGGIVRGGKGKGFGGTDLSAYYENNNRCKKSLVLDLTKPKAREVLYQLVAKSDVFMQNMRQGVAVRLACDYETLKKYNPKLIYCSGSSYGTRGPDATKPGFDPVGIARSGLMYLTGSEKDEPVYALMGAYDQIGAIFGSYAIVAALLARERFGFGQECETSHLAASMYLMGCRLQQQYYSGLLPTIAPRDRAAYPTANHYKCADGEWLMLVSTIPRQWVPLCQALGIPESVYKDDPRFNTPEARAKNSKELIALFDECFAKKTREEHIKSFEGKDIFWERIQKCSDLENDPQVIANEYMTDYTHPLTGQTYKYQNLPMEFRETPSKRQGRAPLLGEHTAEVLVNILGYKKEDVPKLIKEIGEPVGPSEV